MILDQFHCHTYNGGWTISIEQSDDEHKNISIKISNSSFADFTSEINLLAGESQNPLTYHDLCRLGTTFHNAAAKVYKGRDCAY